ncbi:unnamed protein product, partial [Hymenolepis diminuta]
PSIRHTQGTLPRQTHLPLLNPSPPIPYFPLRLCTELCSIRPGLRNPSVPFLSFTVSHQPPQRHRGGSDRLVLRSLPSLCEAPPTNQQYTFHKLV